MDLATLRPAVEAPGLLRYPVAGAGLDPDPGPDQDAEPTMTAPPADRPDAGASPRTVI